MWLRGVTRDLFSGVLWWDFWVFCATNFCKFNQTAERKTISCYLGGCWSGIFLGGLLWCDRRSTVMLQVNRSLLEVYCSRIPDQEQGVYSSWIDESYATEVEGQSSPRLEQQIDLQSCCITKKLQGTTCMRQVNGISSCDLIRMILESLVAPFLLYKAGLKKKPSYWDYVGSPLSTNIQLSRVCCGRFKCA